MENETVEWDRTVPTIPIYGSNEINECPYDIPPEQTPLYEAFRSAKDQSRFDNLRLRFIHVCQTFGFFVLAILVRLGVTDNKSTNATRNSTERREDELIRMICNDFPLPSNLEAMVMDFSPGRCELSRPKFGEVTAWKSKPQWAQIRWIHVPFGRSWVGTFCEDEVLTGGPLGFPFSHTGDLTVSTMSFWSKSAFHRQRDIFLYFSQSISQVNTQISQWLTKHIWDTPELQITVNGYQGQRGRRPRSFWSLAFAQVPLDVDEVSDSPRQSDTFFGHKRRDEVVKSQILTHHPYYRHAHFVKSFLRVYHRSDGFVLTMGPPLGIQYLHRDWFEPSIIAPPHEYPRNTWGSLVPQTFHHLSKGIEAWYQMDEKWLVIYIMTEACLLPSTRLGGPGITPEEAYLIVLQELKQRRRDEWHSPLAVDLVNDLVDLNDELQNWITHLDDQLQMLEWLHKDAITLEKYYHSCSSPSYLKGSAQSPKARVDDVTNMVQKRKTEFQKTFVESNRVLEALFRLRTIQQNELATRADRNNKTMVVFTVVSLIFLPLSFLASYFAILPVTSESAESFWFMGAPMTIGIALFAVAAAFRRNLISGIRRLIGKHHQKVLRDAEHVV